jgi:hypothetical protein
MGRRLVNNNEKRAGDVAVRPKVAVARNSYL